MASYNYATILIVAICLCLFHLSSSQDTVINGKQGCSKAVYNTTHDLRRVLKGGGASGGHAVSSGGHAFSGGVRDSSKIPSGVLAAGAVGAGVAAAGASSHSNYHQKSNGSPICTRTYMLSISLVSIGLSSFLILSRLSRG